MAKAIAYNGSAIGEAKAERIMWCDKFAIRSGGDIHLLVAATEHGHAGNRPRHGDHRRRWHVHLRFHRPSPISRFPRRRRSEVLLRGLDRRDRLRPAKRVRLSHSVIVGYTALDAAVSAEEWQTADKSVELTITTKTLDGEGQKAEGTIKVYELRQPKQVKRPELSGMNYVQPMPRLSKGAAKGAMPAPRPDPGNMSSWPLGDLVETKGFATDASGKT